MMTSQNRKPLTIKVPQYENETKRTRNIILYWRLLQTRLPNTSLTKLNLMLARLGLMLMVFTMANASL